MSEPYGRTSPAPFAHYDPDTSSWRTSQPSLQLENLPEPSPTWPRSGTWDLGAAYELPTSELPTAAPESSSLLLATPTAAIAKGGAPQDSKGKRDLRLDLKVRLLPTPEAKLSDSGPDYARRTERDRAGTT